jgi:hypothetical protein
MKFDNVDLRRAGKRWDASLGVFLGLLALLALAGWRGFSAIGEFLTVVQKQAKNRPTPRPQTNVPITVEDRK